MSKEATLEEIENLLQKTSRTFALTIPLLPEPTRREVSVAYLLFRIIDTFEDATRWTHARRIEALARFEEVLDGPVEAGLHLAAECAREPPLDHAGYLDLLGKVPLVLEAFRKLRPRAQSSIRDHLRRSSEGMRGFVARSAGPGKLELQTFDDLRAYCYAVAGIVGEMLTELFLLDRPALLPIAAELKSRAAAFGEGLQLVNILKDADPDAREGRRYLPRNASTREVFALAEADLATAEEYTNLLRSAHVERGLIGFNAFVIRLATGTLRVLRDQGLGSKLTRLHVATIAADVAQAIGRGAPLFPDRLASVG
jgi:farnesyl-diphosphate farnesyltransferase